jgi:hypothetical protein
MVKGDQGASGPVAAAIRSRVQVAPAALRALPLRSAGLRKGLPPSLPVTALVLMGIGGGAHVGFKFAAR